jgi:glucose-1-phosphate cytidylyltransferase
MNPDPALFFEQAPLQDLARDGELAVFEHDGFWMGMDTYREFSALNDMWTRGEAPWKVWGDHPVVAGASGNGWHP